MCFCYVIISVRAQESSGLEFNKTTSSNINSSVVDTLRDFLDNFLEEYQNVCQPNPCHKSEECVRIGEDSYRCVCPPGLEQIMEESSSTRYHFNLD